MAKISQTNIAQKETGCIPEQNPDRTKPNLIIVGRVNLEDEWIWMQSILYELSRKAVHIQDWKYFSYY